MPLARQQLQIDKTQSCDLVFVDDHAAVGTLNGHEVLTYENWLARPATSRHICLAVGNSAVREKLATRCTDDSVEFFEVRASNVVVMDDVVIGPGAVLNPFVTLLSNVRIGTQFQCNIYSYVAHDCVIGNFVTFAPGVKCNGNVIVEDHAYIGTGAILRQGKPGEPLIIGRGAVVGMGAVVTKNVSPGTTVVGNPARVMAAKSSN